MHISSRGAVQDSSRSRARVLALLPFWLALVGAFAEVLVVHVRRLQQPLMTISGEFVWMAPLALFAVVGAVVAILGLVARVWRHRALAGLRLFVPTALIALNLLMLVPGLAHYAAAVLASGLAVQMTRVALGHPDAIDRLMRRTVVLIAAAFAIAGAYILLPLESEISRAEAPGTVQRSPNVLLITLDTVRAANLSAYGYARKTTPRIDQLSRRGVVFEDALSTAPWTLPSHASLFTGRWPHELSADHSTPLDAAFPTLAEYLRDRGYATAGFVANMKYCGAATGLNRGFARYDDYSRSLGEIASSSTLVRTVANNFRLRRLLQNDEHLNRITAAELSSRALDWMAGQSGAPFFAFVNYFDAHEPYLPPPPFDRQFGPGRRYGRHSPLHHWLWNPAVGHRPLEDAVRQEEIDAYDGGLAHLDVQVGRLIDDLDRLGILDNTLVIITSDHGEEFSEHGVYEHGYSLYRPSVHVPLIMVGPGTASQRVAVPVSLRDLAATIVDLVGLGGDAPFPGTSLAQLWREHPPGVAPVELSPLLTEVSPSLGQPDWFPSSRGEMKALVHQGLRYIRNGDGREELYDFIGDRWEQKDLASLPERQQALADARAALDRLLARGR